MSFLILDIEYYVKLIFVGALLKYFDVFVEYVWALSNILSLCIVCRGFVLSVGGFV